MKSDASPSNKNSRATQLDMRAFRDIMQHLPLWKPTPAEYYLPNSAFLACTGFSGSPQMGKQCKVQCLTLFPSRQLSWITPLKCNQWHHGLRRHARFNLGALRRSVPTQDQNLKENYLYPTTSDKVSVCLQAQGRQRLVAEGLQWH